LPELCRKKGRQEKSHKKYTNTNYKLDKLLRIINIRKRYNSDFVYFLQGNIKKNFVTYGYLATVFALNEANKDLIFKLAKRISGRKVKDFVIHAHQTLFVFINFAILHTLLYRKYRSYTVQ
jgi:hypothetical protein